jgi:hypothetical protein
MIQNAVHYVASDQPVGTVVKNSYSQKVCREVSAGHTRHEYTTGYAHDEILKHFGFAGEAQKEVVVPAEKAKCDIL